MGREVDVMSCSDSANGYLLMFIHVHACSDHVHVGMWAASAFYSLNIMYVRRYLPNTKLDSSLSHWA